MPAMLLRRPRDLARDVNKGTRCERACTGNSRGPTQSHMHNEPTEVRLWAWRAIDLRSSKIIACGNSHGPCAAHMHSSALGPRSRGRIVVDLSRDDVPTWYRREAIIPARTIRGPNADWDIRPR
jgi:hypothetical protein